MAALRGHRHLNKPLQAAYNADPRGWTIRSFEMPEDRERLRQISAENDLGAKRES